MSSSASTLKEGIGSMLQGLPNITSPSTSEDGPDSGNGPNRICVPGQILYRAGNNYQAGDGCYEFHGSIYASLVGFVHVFPLKEGETEGPKVVEVRSKIGEKNCTIPAPGRVVTARVEQIQQKAAKCSIICVEDTVLSSPFASTLRKEDAREKERDKVELYKFVQPGDIILARVLGFGESQTAYLLTIAEDELGVISARGPKGERLVPETAETVKAPDSDYREPRKCAQVPNLDFL